MFGIARFPSLSCYKVCAAPKLFCVPRLVHGLDKRAAKGRIREPVRRPCHRPAECSKLASFIITFGFASTANRSLVAKQTSSIGVSLPHTINTLCKWGTAKLGEISTSRSPSLIYL
ncbi:hypothetical protein BDV40DRAFT_57755 [Aspergillus tamarii]|uniref:Uncharacterized protein n=1 Tax=Aspergillus tamarii TaxID=41984 RepID=A0A5N6V406_ASPTM|nr:hypothetical protein BDV40DRAFT_57755 [Aspergillus tamarii]